MTTITTTLNAGTRVELVDLDDLTGFWLHCTGTSFYFGVNDATDVGNKLRDVATHLANATTKEN